MKKILKQIILFFIVCVSIEANAQTNALKGIVIDGESKEEIIGARVILLNTNFKVLTDIYGSFKFEKLPIGDYDLEVIYSGYTKYSKKVTITTEQEVNLTVELVNDVKTFETVKVVAERKTNTENAVILEIREAKSVVSGISKEQIARSQDKSAADVMQRIPGITIVEGRFALIRGVNSRYNSVTINNVSAPSTEVDRKTFSFDLISSGSLDRMMIYKSASPDYPGDFAGGVIKLYTVNSLDKDFFTVKLDLGYRANTTFSPYFQSKGSSTDFLGFDRSFRGIPDGIPTTSQLALESKTSEVRNSVARKFSNNFKPNESTALPNMGIAINFGKILNIKNKKITTVNSINYSSSFQTFEKEFYRYDIWTDLNTPINPRFKFIDQTSQKDNKINIMSNWSMKISDRSKIKFSNLFNQIGENETIIRNGEDYQQRPGEDLKNYLLSYKSRTIYTGQLEGTHALGENEKNELNWVVGASYLGELEPDLRRFRTFKKQDSTVYLAQFSPSSNLFDNSRYYGKLGEISVSNGLTYNHTLSTTEKKKKSIKVGYYTDYRNRKFSSRYFSYTYPGFFDPSVINQLIRMDVDQIFAPENFKTQDGLIIEEGTRPIDSYQASNFLVAGFIGTDLNYDKLNVNGGIRTEYNIQNMNSQDDFGAIVVRNPILSILPSLNLAYNISKNNVLRASYGRTINRPEFRELAPFLFYDYELESSRVGNPELKTATIDNIDVRFENYPRPGETYSIGAFYKRFTNPIEDKLILTTEQSSLTYVNADYAFNYGIEVEIKKSLKDMTRSKFLDKLSLNFNASYIFSQVDLGTTATAQDRVRPLQGQAPYIVNGAIYYNNNKAKINASLIYNVYGRNIFAVGDVSFPTMYELERHSLDFTFGKDLNNGVSLKFGIQNILDAPFRYFQDSNRNGKIDGDDHVIINLRRGSLFTASVTYDLKHRKNKAKEVTPQ